MCVYVCIHSYSLEQTERFLRFMLDEGPVRTVVAPPPSRTPSREREKVHTHTIHVHGV